jgi:tetratricopeptide (TPR) repeat protein
MAVLCSLAGEASAQATTSEIESADQLFKAGKFAEARELYEQIVAQSPNDDSAILQLGRIALLSNKLDEALDWLRRALALDPSDTDAPILLAEAYYRRDDFQKAAAALNGIDVATNKLIIEQYPTLNIAKLESFKGQTPYELHGDGDTSRLNSQEPDRCRSSACA